jgi:small-conductance mechanosensitive channel/CRP-like cAMP-binding protein
MSPTLNLLIAVGALLLLILARFGRSLLLRGTRWTLTLVAVTALLAWALGVAGAGSRWEEPAAIALLVALGLLAARAAVALVVEWLLVQRVGVVMPRLARDVVSLLLYVVVTAMVLHSAAGISLNLTVPTAVLTVLVGLAMQETLGTLLSGLTLAWERRLETGVWVEIDGIEGAVEELGWRSLVLRTNLDERILIPNSQIAKARIKLLGTGDPPVAFRVHMHVAYSVPPHAVKRVLREACRDLPFTVPEPAPRLLAIKFDENGVLYECRLWTREPRRHNDIVDALLTRAHAAFLREGFEIPLPQRVLRRPSPAAAAIPAERCRAALVRCPLFDDLPADAMAALAGASRWLQYAPLEAVVREGDESRALYVVGVGEAAVLHGGEEVARVAEGEVFGEMAFLSGEPRSATVRAAEALGVVEIDSAALRALLTDHEELAEELAGRMVARRAALEAHDEASAAPREHRGLATYLLQRLQRLVSS